MVVNTVRIIVVYQNKILFLRKSQNSKNPGAFEFPGGKIDNTDDALSTVVKELYEETGISIDLDIVKALDITKKYNFRSNDSDQLNQRFVEYFYVLLNNYFDIKLNQEEDKHDYSLWVDVNEIQEFFDSNFISENSKVDLKILSFLKK